MTSLTTNGRLRQTERLGRESDARLAGYRTLRSKARPGKGKEKGNKLLHEKIVLWEAVGGGSHYG